MQSPQTNPPSKIMDGNIVEEFFSVLKEYLNQKTSGEADNEER